MSVIDIRRRHSFTLAEARQHADQLASDLRKEFGLATQWRDNVLEFRRDGVDGQLTVGQNDVHLHAKLGFVLSLLRPKIEASIHGHMDELFAAGTQTAPKRRRRAPGGRKSPNR